MSAHTRQIVSADLHQTGPMRGRLDDLADQLRGRLVVPTDPDYDGLRSVWNGSIDRRPGLIVRCAGVADVIAAVTFGRETGLEVAVRGGGHSFPGLSVVDHGLVIDLGPMKGVRVDPATGTVRVQAGVLIGEMDRETQAFGMAVPSGAVSHTGVAGLTLGGGIGWLMRKHGLAIDQLRSVDVVTADGHLVSASDDHNPELFWGVRGGGGNFGVVTAFEFDLNPVGPEVLSALVLWPFADARAVTGFYRDWSARAPDELTTALVFRCAPDLDPIPDRLRGQPVVGVIGCWTGALVEGEQFLEPMRRFGAPVVDLTARRPFLEHQTLLDASYPHGIWVYLRACDVAGLTDGVIDIAVDHAARICSPRSGVIAWQLGGAVAEVDSGDTAFGSRDAGFIFNISGITAGPEGFDRERAWVRRYFDALAPHRAGVYVNFLMEEGPDRVRAAYGRRRFERLQRLKAVYDPDNLFHLNQNIPPG